MSSVDMLKKLLDEFSEQEAHSAEELNVINQQIEELERRIAVSRKRLESIGHDRERLLQMKERYGANYNGQGASGGNRASSGSSSGAQTASPAGSGSPWSAPSPQSNESSKYDNFSPSTQSSGFDAPTLSDPLAYKSRQNAESNPERAEIEQLAEAAAAAADQDATKQGLSNEQAADAKEAIERFSPTKALVRASSTRLKALQQASNAGDPAGGANQEAPPGQQGSFQSADANASLAQINPFAIMGQSPPQDVQPEAPAQTQSQPAAVAPTTSSGPVFDWGPPQPTPQPEGTDYRIGLHDSAFATSQSANKSIEDAIAAAGSSPFFTGHEEHSSPFSMPMPAMDPNAQPNSMFGQQTPPQTQLPLSAGKPGNEEHQQAPKHNVSDLEPDDDSDDPGKSINDALRGLFR